MNRLIDHLRWLVEQPLGDADLLDRFIERREDTAFAALLKRHGPMVLGVCGSQPSRHSVSITASHLTAFILYKEPLAHGYQETRHPGMLTSKTI